MRKKKSITATMVKTKSKKNNCSILCMIGILCHCYIIYESTSVIVVLWSLWQSGMFAWSFVSELPGYDRFGRCLPRCGWRARWCGLRPGLTRDCGTAIIADCLFIQPTLCATL